MAPFWEFMTWPLICVDHRFSLLRIKAAFYIVSAWNFEVEFSTVCCRVFTRFLFPETWEKRFVQAYGALQFTGARFGSFKCMDFLLCCVLFAGSSACFVLRTRNVNESCLFGEYLSSFHMYFPHLAVSPCAHSIIRGLVNRSISELDQK